MVSMQWFTAGGGVLDPLSLIWLIPKRAAGQSVVRVQNLDTLDTNEPLLKGI